MQNNRQYRITYKTLFQKIMKFAIPNAFNIYFMYSYITIPKELRNDTANKCFLTYIILSCILTLRTLIDLIYTWSYMGQIMTEHIWKIILPTDKFCFKLIDLLACLGCLGLGCYFMRDFLPTGEMKCDDQTYGSKNGCISFQIISVITAIALAYLALILSLILLLCCCLREIHNNPIKQNHILNKVISHLPTIKIVPNETICAICLEGPDQNSDEMKSSETTHQIEHGIKFFETINQNKHNIKCLERPDQNKHDLVVVDVNQQGGVIEIKNLNRNKKWISLNCAHKLHQDCATSWLSKNPICPLCRAPQSGLTQELTTIAIP